MFEKKTTIVLGAGASCSYGYPLGDQLIDRLINIAQSNTKMIQKQSPKGALVEYSGNSLVMNMANILSFYDPNSIDSFLNHYKDDKDFIRAAKTFISEIITGSGEEHLFMRGALYGQPNEIKRAHWYRFIWSSLVEGLSAVDLASKDVALNFNIITFNYDTSLEYFLYTRINSNDSFLTSEHKSSLLNKLKDSIHHVYGSFIRPKWMGGDDENTLLRFGPQNLLVKEEAKKRSGNIHLINERADLDFATPRTWLKDCQQVIFLGFGFDDANIGSSVLNLRETLKPRLEDVNNPNNRNWLPVFKYTNYGDSEVINSKVRDLIAANVGTHMNDKFSKYDDIRVYKSDKDVYSAISDDFPLNRY